MGRYLKLRFCLGAFGLLLGAAPLARADVSSWLYTGVGPAFIKQSGASDSRLVLQLESGIGTTPTRPIVFGGVFKLPIYLGAGTDLGFAIRTATRGFVQGDWGGAIDLGVYQRWWGLDSSGISGNLVLGGPWGTTVSLGVSGGSHDTQTYSATFGIDFARLTAHRSTGQSWWKNRVLPIGD